MFGILEKPVLDNHHQWFAANTILRGLTLRKFIYQHHVEMKETFVEETKIIEHTTIIIYQLMNLAQYIKNPNEELTKFRYNTCLNKNSLEHLITASNSDPPHPIEYFTAGHIVRSQIEELERLIDPDDRLTALEALLTKSSQQKFCIFRHKDDFMVITNRKLKAKEHFQIMAVYWEILKRERDLKFDILDSFIDGLKNNDIGKARKALEDIVQLKVIQNLNNEAYEKIFKYNRSTNLGEYKNQLTSIINNMKNLERQYSEMNKKYVETNAIYERAKRLQQNVNVADILQHIRDCEYIKEYKIYESTGIQLDYYAPIISYDETRAERRKFGASETEAEIYDIFANHGNEYEIWTKVSIALMPQSEDVHSITRVINGDISIGHPHLHYYGCRGDHIDYIQKYLREADYKMAINQITEMVLEFNFADSIVTNDFINRINNHKNTKLWKKKSTGEFISTYQVIEEIKNGKTETNN